MVDTSYLPALGCASRSEGGGYSGPVIGLSSVTRARRTQARRTRATDCYPATFVSVTRRTSPSSGYGKQGSRAADLSRDAQRREGGFFKWEWVKVIQAIPAAGVCVRYWDLAGTEGDGDWTAGVLMSRVRTTMASRSGPSRTSTRANRRLATG